MKPMLDRAVAVAASWPALAGAPVRPLGGGLINDTWSVGEPPVAVLQRQHTLFPPRVNDDIEAVTAHVQARGLLTPRPLRTDDDQLFRHDGEGRCWRALTWVGGRTVHRLTRPDMAAEAGRLVARWHRATEDLDHDFRHVRPGAHDTPAHMARLSQALLDHPQHRLRSEVAALADGVLEAWSRWQGEPDGPPRVVHGDLKISNLRFDERGRGLCLLDFDTLSRQPLEVELGDAARSWCNPRGEDTGQAEVDRVLFGAAFGAWLQEYPQPTAWRRQLVCTLERICLELAARFAADALAEAYFGWNPEVAPTRGAHNLLRARGQASLARSVGRHRGDLERSIGAG